MTKKMKLTPGKDRKKTPAKKEAAPVNPSKAMYDSLHKAFDHFNKELFDGKLPPVILVVHRKRNAHGYFWDGQWRKAGSKSKKDRMPEIALNPQTMGRSVKEVLSTLVHEMVHWEQYSFGTPPKTAYHNKEWAEMMDEVGLIPTTTGQKGGPRTGRNCTHLIEEGGKFDVSCDKLLKLKSFDMSWFSPAQATIRRKDLSKVKHTCPICEVNIWGKQGIFVKCGDCNAVMEEAD